MAGDALVTYLRILHVKFYQLPFRQENSTKMMLWPRNAGNLFMQNKKEHRIKKCTHNCAYLLFIRSTRSRWLFVLIQCYKEYLFYGLTILWLLDYFTSSYAISSDTSSLVVKFWALISSYSNFSIFGLLRLLR